VHLWQPNPARGSTKREKQGKGSTVHSSQAKLFARPLIRARAGSAPFLALPRALALSFQIKLRTAKAKGPGLDVEESALFGRPGVQSCAGHPGGRDEEVRGTMLPDAEAGREQRRETGKDMKPGKS
jgi:hypothetical protein